MKKISLILVLLIGSLGMAKADRQLTDEEIKCMYIKYDHRYQVFHYENGKETPLELWFEEHPEEAEKYYRRNAEMRKRAMKNIAAGLCPK